MNPISLVLKPLKAAVFSCFYLFVLANSLPAQQGGGVPITTGTWNMVLTQGIPESANNWEQLVYAPAIQQSIMLSQYHQSDTEPNETLLGYNFDTNRWDIVDMGGAFHTENMPEGGESQGYFDFNPSNSTLVYHCCTSGSNQPEDANHTWWYDVMGQSGRDKQNSPEPSSVALQPGGAFDVAHGVFVAFGGASNIGTWTYNPASNSWQQQTPTGTVPNPSLILPGMAYSSSAQQVFLFGGMVAGTYYSDLHTYNVSTNTWTKISPVGGVQPPGRYRTNFAYDSTNNIFLLYGGQNASGILGDTWVYNPVANTWTQLTPSQSPPVGAASDFARLSYDSDHNAFVFAHKANGGYFGGNWATLSLQTWLFRYNGSGPNPGTAVSSVQPSSGSINRNAASWANEPVLASSGNSLFVAWSETGSPFDLTNSTWPHIYADQYSNGSWINLGTYQSISGASLSAHSPGLTIIGGTPWVSWYQPSAPTNTDSSIFVANWNGTTWQSNPIGLEGASTSYFQGRSQLADIGGMPYIGYLEVNKTVYPQADEAYVKAWNGTSWVPQGSGPLNHSSGAGSTASSISIASDGTFPYAAWTEYTRNFTVGDSSTPPLVYVSHWNGSQWNAVGGSLNVSSSDWADDASIAYFGGQPYVAWTERTQAGNAQLYVATWNGTAWARTGSGSLNQGGANGWAYHPSLVADNVGNHLYLGWVEQTALGQKAQIFVDQLSGSSWNMLGSALNANPTEGSAQRMSLGVYNGQPVAAWGEVNLTSLRNIYVSLWNGSSWTQLPGSGGAADTTPPTTPTGVSATAASSSQINVSWTGSTDIVGVAGYYVYRNGSEVTNDTTVLNYQDIGLNPGTLYSYTVAAHDAAGNVSAMSSAAKATTLGNGDTSPSVSITSPTNGAAVSGTAVTLSANATDSSGMSGVQFQIDNANMGSQVEGSGPSYSTTWNSTTVANGSHKVTAIATDTQNHSSSTSVMITVNNTAAGGLVISAVSAGSVTSSGAIINWMTNSPATSQVNYGTTTSYNLSSGLNSTLVTSHSVTLTNLSASTIYDYQVVSQDSNGDNASSANFTFTTSAAGLQTLLQIQGNPSELSGTTNGSVITPSDAPNGFAGTLKVNGTGSVNFAPVQSGNGLYFLNCCKNTNDAYYHFSGSAVGNIFKVNQGQISFSLQSQYSFAQRQAIAAMPRYAFDVRDGNGNHLFWFLTQVTSNGLQFNYTAGNPVQIYYVPKGTENTLFGDGVTLQVLLTWGQGSLNLYLNNTLVKSSSYTPPTANWSASSILDIGAYEYLTFGGYNVSDDVIFGYTVAAPVSQ